MREAVIVDAIRTPIGRKKGMFSQVHPVDLLVPVLKSLVERNQLDPSEIDDVICGCVTMTDEQGGNIGRMSVLAAGLPVEIPAFSLNRMCGSSQQAIHNASQAILANDDDIVIACGVENMSRVPMASDIGNFSEQLLDKHQVIPQGMSAELIAEHWQLSRQELDEFAYESHQKAIEATDKGLFSREILPFRENGQEIKTDEGIRRDTNLQKLSELTPSFNPSSGVITAGNSSQISDGAAGVLMMSYEKAKQLGLKPRAKIIARSVVGIDPVMMLTGVIPATEKVLKKAGLTLDQMDVIEINEAFASVVKAWAKELKPDMKKVNPRGGAIALGHPLGASGARIMTTLLHTLEDMDGKYGLQVMCIGFGMATATIIEKME
ncbi:3-ketoacyl-CoA thiolase [Caldibacillus thermoamylovorans]|uniref:3-ketoacyl-CoA thiolase n=1 Tax=Caldibacillus thermoamylovorans TaxID=35841 RepID=A0A0D0F6V4_9BACI|nr:MULTISPECIES: thiolase family protein [Bacillaceae]AWI12345.1 acetyl-CoA C-acyltransferase [Caldibacillus thermoamylovorans]KIO58786.1 3-ketoacyl-CoA thiolase [Caldibacillus thermoamylovorans]KIO67842.1 3-ketoacyl-CoA thiolase [Caldibacillus thermoamylovorans]KIO71067.1 3-ketoacyl-CoA thiolase [Caldibacillus thermoamylovorans]KIO74121.1 3-ketoacyl-CoA thiolase [Caldibacillus thermoamylovorans]